MTDSPFLAFPYPLGATVFLNGLTAVWAQLLLLLSARLWTHRLAAAIEDPPRTLFEGDAWRRTVAYQGSPGVTRKRPVGQLVKEIDIAAQHPKRRTAKLALGAGARIAAWR